MFVTLGVLFSMVGWITVVNPEGIKNGNGFFAFGETCVLESTQHVAPLRAGPELTLYRLERTAGRAFGTQCPTGTLFLMGPEAFEQLRAKETTAETAKAKLRRNVEEMLKQ